MQQVGSFGYENGRAEFLVLELKLQRNHSLGAGGSKIDKLQIITHNLFFKRILHIFMLFKAKNFKLFGTLTLTMY